MLDYTVYMHENIINNKKYIGITSQKTKERWRNGNGYKGCISFYNAIQKYGWDNFNHIILYTNLTKKEAEDKEIELISKYKTNNKKYGYNICSGGNGTPSHTVSEATKDKLRKSSSNMWKNPEIRNKIITNSKRGMSNPEVRQKISNIHKGKKPWNKNKRGDMNKTNKHVLCIETGQIFESTRIAEEYTGVNHANIVKCCNNKYNTAGNFHWIYCKED